MTPEVFWASTIRDPETGCWRWTRGHRASGYGGAHVVEGDGGYAHRAAYILTNGYPGNYQIDHLCRVLDCVNPAHLEAVTGRVNAQRGANSALRHLRRRPAA